MLSCGLDVYQYLPPVSEPITRISNDQATIPLPNISDSNILANFTHYTIFYRIYISGNEIPSEIDTPEERGDPDTGVNSALAQDYNTIEPYTITTTSSTTNVSTLFKNRNYHELTYERDGSEEHNVLSKSTLGGGMGGTLHLNFTTGAIPTLAIETADPDPLNWPRWNLYRSNGNGTFNPGPLVPDDRYFRNTSNLNSSDKANPGDNADVADKTGISGPRYTYAAMYIVTTGIETPAYTPIYSIPTFVSIFLLPN
ncbi:hypothetical protein AGMMS49587_19040 [Spirochaetia bacterium]|nr:hypothetical protein AGMMS49587_19040 [Spirochaetia bacterium]